MSEKFGLREFERFRVVLPREEDAGEEEWQLSASRCIRPGGRASSARISEPVLDEPGGYAWLSRAEQTLVFVKRLYQTGA